MAVELPRKYMKKHWVSVAILLLPVMTCGWLVVGLFVWVLIPHFNFSSALLVSACVTATDPVLAAAVVGKGKFAERVPGHLRNLLTAESGCNDGMAFPFIYLSLNLIVHSGNAGEIVKDWFTLTILWECLFGVVLGVTLGYTLRKAVAFAEKKNLIDRESFLALFAFLAFNSAGIGSMLGVDDLLVSFAAGTAFGWNGDFARKTEESHVSTVIDLLLNLSFFVYFGAIVPWPDFNNPSIGLNVWRLVVLAIVVVFLRRIPAVLALKPFTPDIKSWREALFCGHFGPIGVGAIFAAILAKRDLEKHYTESHTVEIGDTSASHYQLIVALWPIICFIVITSIVVHGSSVAVLTLGKRLNRMAITMSFTVTNTQDQGGPAWMSRLQKLDKVSTSFSLHRIDTAVPDNEDQKMSRTNTVETSGVKVRPAGGARRKKHKRRKGHRRSASRQDEGALDLGNERQRPQTEFLQLGKSYSHQPLNIDNEESPETVTGSDEIKPHGNSEEASPEAHYQIKEDNLLHKDESSDDHIPTTIYQDGQRVIVEDERGEVIDTGSIASDDDNGENIHITPENTIDGLGISIHSMGSLRKHMSNFSVLSNRLHGGESEQESIGRKITRSLSSQKKTIVPKGEKGHGKKYFAHQVDNLIVIENSDGEIVRRYRLNKHEAPKTRNRSGTIMGKALSLVGLKNKDGNNPEQGEAPPKPGSPPINEKVDRLAVPSRGRLSPEPLYDGLDTLLDHSGSEYETEDDGLPEETEVEKRRRLAALGHIADDRNDSDEEV